MKKKNIRKENKILQFEHELTDILHDGNISTEEYTFMKDAQKDIYKKVVIGAGITGILFYTYSVIKTTIAKLGTALITHKVITGTIIAITAVGSGSYVVINKIFEDDIAHQLKKELVIVKPIQKAEGTNSVTKKQIPLRYTIGIEQFEVNLEDPGKSRSITQKVYSSIKAKKGKHFAKLLYNKNTNSKYILKGVVDFHGNDQYRVSIKLFDIKTSKIIKMDTGLITGKPDIQNKCVTMSLQLIKDIK